MFDKLTRNELARLNHKLSSAWDQAECEYGRDSSFTRELFDLCADVDDAQNILDEPKED